MTAKTNPKLVKLTVGIRPGQGTPAQKQAWRKFWQKLITQVQDEVKK